MSGCQGIARLNWWLAFRPALTRHHLASEEKAARCPVGGRASLRSPAASRAAHTVAPPERADELITLGVPFIIFIIFRTDRMTVESSGRVLSLELVELAYLTVESLPGVEQAGRIGVRGVERLPGTSEHMAKCAELDVAGTIA